ncbi:MAG: phosphoribosylglycinamide formyltransferase [Prochlorotrichaceae cyanobacterium]|jgi:phosphoribosylglycinamide formyltransferase-1
MNALISPLPPSLDQVAVAPLQLGVLASGSGSNFEAILTAIAQGHLQATVKVLVYNNPEAKVADRADRGGIPKVLLDHRTFARREDLDHAIVSVLQTHGVDWVVMAGWMRIVTPELINAYPQRIVNIHPSLLPAFKGIRAIEQALAAGVAIAGCTVHLVEPEVDSGRILMQAAVPVLPEDTPETLQARIQVQEHHIFPAALQRLALDR